MVVISQNITINVPSMRLLENTELVISNKNRYGLIGFNGSGKSTLLKFILKLPDIDVHMIDQEVPMSTVSVTQYVLESNHDRINLLKEYNKIAETDDIKKINELSTKINQLELYKDEPIVRKILAGLGFNSENQDASVNSFSGGWRMRIAIASALYRQPDLLLLDEPTNHLDLEACIWLTEYLSKWTKTLIVVSHDTNFLDEICTNIIRINNETKKLRYYKGNYGRYDKEKITEDAHLEKEWKKLDKQVDELRKKSTKKDKIDEIIKKANLDPRPKPYKISINFALSDQSQKPLKPGPHSTWADRNILELQNICFGYSPDKILFKNISFGISPNSRITFVGKNGIGKSTLMKLLIGKLMPTSGEIIRDNRVKIEYFEQHCIQELPENLSAIEYISQLDTNLKEQEIRKLLGTVGLRGDLHNAKLVNYSGGQRVRIALTAIQVKKPNIIVLDEPTNHLDIETISALIDGIKCYTGGLIMITHNIRLIEETNSILYEVTEDGIYETNYNDYKEQILNY